MPSITLRLILVFIMSCSLFGFSQNHSIKGHVLDSNNSPIEFANVVLYSEDGSEFVKGTSTDSLGMFRLDEVSKNSYNISITFIGFKTFNKAIVLETDLDLGVIEFKESSESLDEVQIVSKKPTITRKPDRLVFNIEDTALTENTTLSVLKSTPGIIVSEQSINIKSAPATVYINNRKIQLSPNELIQLLESTPANTIKSVEVITNPPASYDADSGQVIEITMSKNLITGYRGSIHSNFTQGVFPRYNYGTSHFFKNDDINFNVNYNYTNQKINRDTDNQINFLNPANQLENVWLSRINRNTRTETHNINANFDYYINNKSTLSLNSTTLYVPFFNYQINNSTTIFDPNLNFDSGFTANNLSRDNKLNIGTDLIFKHELDNNSSLTLNGHYTLYDYERGQNVFQDAFQNNNASEFITLANQNTKILTGQADYSTAIDEGGTFDAGIKYSNIDTDSDITRLDIINGNVTLNTQNTDTFKYKERVFASYMNYSNSWEKFAINIGLRTEQTTIEGVSQQQNQTNIQDYFNWFPNASLSYQLSDEVSIYGTYNRSIQRPSYTDLNPFTLFLNENTQVLGNPNLVPTYINHFKIGTNFLEHFTLEAYYMDYDGDIAELPRQNNLTNVISYTPVNLDDKVDYGFDLAFEINPTENWYLYAVTSFYNISEEANFGNGFVELDQWSNYSVLMNNLSFLEDNSLSINMTLTWVGKNLQHLQAVEDRLFSELSITKSLWNKKGVISLSVEDAFNFQDADVSVNYLNQSSFNFIDLDNRFVKLGFRYNFGNTKLSTNERTSGVIERDRIKDAK